MNSEQQILDRYEPHEGCAICPDCYRRFKREFSATITAAVDRQREADAQIAENLKDGYSVDVMSGALEKDKDGPWHLGSDVAAAIRNAK